MMMMMMMMMMLLVHLMPPLFFRRRLGFKVEEEEDREIGQYYLTKGRLYVAKRGECDSERKVNVIQYD